MVVSDTGYGIDLLYKQDKFGSLISAVRSQEQIDDSEEKKGVRPESDIETKPDEAGTGLWISKFNIAIHRYCWNEFQRVIIPQ